MTTGQFPKICRKTTKQNPNRSSLHRYRGRTLVTYLINLLWRHQETLKVRYIPMGMKHYLKFHHLIHTVFCLFYNRLLIKCNTLGFPLTRTQATDTLKQPKKNFVWLLEIAHCLSSGEWRVHWFGIWTNAILECYMYCGL